MNGNQFSIGIDEVLVLGVGVLLDFLIILWFAPQVKLATMIWLKYS
jgi:Na+-transporting methylmalonyl-CoA/oxaloacetate decarboxylase gamma subunit